MHNSLRPVSEQIVELFILAIPVACIAWTVTHEEVFREIREWCGHRSKACRTLAERKFFYLFTCEYCFSHYVAALFLLVTRYKLLFPGWRGYLVSEFALVWVANIYMSIFGRLRLDLKRERIEIETTEKFVKNPQGPTSNGQPLPPDHETRDHHGHEQQAITNQNEGRRAPDIARVDPSSGR